MSILKKREREDGSRLFSFVNTAFNLGICQNKVLRFSLMTAMYIWSTNESLLKHVPKGFRSCSKYTWRLPPSEHLLTGGY